MVILNFLAYAYIISLILFVLFVLVFYIFEKKIDGSKPIKKWWRKHVVGLDPEDEYWKNLKR